MDTSGVVLHRLWAASWAATDQPNNSGANERYTQIAEREREREREGERERQRERERERERERSNPQRK
jgi:hypothetical protein